MLLLFLCFSVFSLPLAPVKEIKEDAQEKEVQVYIDRVAAFRQDHGRGIMIHVTSQRAEDGLRVVIRKTTRTSVRGGRPAARL